MSHVLLSLLILATSPAAPISKNDSSEKIIYRCGFEAEHDLNFDSWPDGWRRQLGRGLPSYVSFKIRPGEGVAGSSCLHVELDGGGAVASSPPVDVGSAYAYRITGIVRTQGLQHNEAFLSLEFLDEKKRPVIEHLTRKLRGSQPWTPLILDSIVTDDPRVRFAVVKLNVLPGRSADLTGSVSFDEIKLTRRARLEATTNRPLNIFDDPSDVKISFRATGFGRPRPSLQAEVFDAFGHSVGISKTWILEPRKQEVASKWELRGKLADSSTKQAKADTMDGAVDWSPPLSEYGFYRIQVTLRADGVSIAETNVTLVVTPPLRQPLHGHFGWSLPHGEGNMPLTELVKLAGDSGVHWIKFPFWHAADDSKRQSELVQFVGRLAWRNVQIIGLLHDPPKNVRQKFILDDDAPHSAASVFSQPAQQWQPSLQDLMLPMGMNVRMWQLGDDLDHSFMGHPRRAEIVANVNRELGKFGLDSRLAIGWDLRRRPPHLPEKKPGGPGGRSPWYALTYLVDSSISPEELGESLKKLGFTKFQRWVTLEPLPSQGNAISARIVDLAHRMAAATEGGADAVFLSDPLNPKNGLFDAKGRPSELFLPWRTTAKQLAGARYLGRLQLPGGSENRVFQRGDRTIVMIWNSTPQQEILYLGEEVRQIDIWGAVTQPNRREQGSLVNVGRLPSFIEGTNSVVTRIALATSITPKRLPSVPGVRHALQIHVGNSLKERAVGKVIVKFPKRWSILPDTSLPLDIDPGEEHTLTLRVRLPINVASGRHLVRLDFDMHADRSYRFSVYRYVSVGLGDVKLDVSTRLDADNNLIVEQRLHITGKAKMRFRCHLAVPKQRWRRAALSNLGPGVHTHIYTLPQGDRLLGKRLFIRVEQLGGSKRVLSRTFMAEP